MQLVWRRYETYWLPRCFAFVMSRRKAFVGRPRSPRDILASHTEFIRLPGRRLCSIPFSSRICFTSKTYAFILVLTRPTTFSLVFRLHKCPKRCQKSLLKYLSIAYVTIMTSQKLFTWEIFNFAFNICLLYFIESISEILRNNLLDTIPLHLIIDFIYIYIIYLNFCPRFYLHTFFYFKIFKRDAKMRFLKYRSC